MALLLIFPCCRSYRLIVAFILLLAAALPAVAEKLPRVLLIGDSISFGYEPYVKELLGGKAEVHRIEGTVDATLRPQGGLRLDTVAAIERLDTWLGEGRWDVIHFNWGLHDLKIGDAGVHQVSLAEYAENLTHLVERLKKTGATLIWASTTPVPDGVGRGAFTRKAGDELAYNKTAAVIMQVADIRINDLHSLSMPNLATWQQPRNVHFEEVGSRGLATQVAASIETALAERRRDPFHRGTESIHR